MRMKMRKMRLNGWLALAFMLLAAVATIPTAADASTAKGTVIENRATVTYDAGGVAQTPVTAAAFVTITLVQGAPNVTVNTVSATTINQGQSTTISYYVSATSNGPETYTFGSGSAVVSNMSAAGTGGATTPLSFSLGATTLAANAAIGATTIKVPYDQVAALTDVNGIAPGDTIIIGGNPYVVAAAGINKTNATLWGDANYNLVTITLTSAIAVTAGTAGQVVGERTTFSVTYTSGTVSVGQVTGTYNENGTASSGGPTGTSPNTLITVNKPALTVAKEVSVDGGTSYSSTGNAAPGVSLIYRITITNSGGGDATLVQITDTLPPYLTYVSGASKYATSVATTYAAATALTEGAGGFTFVGSTVTYNPGSPGVGTVTPAGVLVLFYRCMIN